jgi:hypothetical protein
MLCPARRAHSAGVHVRVQPEGDPGVPKVVRPRGSRPFGATPNRSMCDLSVLTKEGGIGTGRVALAARRFGECTS